MMKRREFVTLLGRGDMAARGAWARRLGKPGRRASSRVSIGHASRSCSAIRSSSKPRFNLKPPIVRSDWLSIATTQLLRSAVYLQLSSKDYC
jgi:hypothetical protein